MMGFLVFGTGCSTTAFSEGILEDITEADLESLFENSDLEAVSIKSFEITSNLSHFQSTNVVSSGRSRVLNLLSAEPQLAMRMLNDSEDAKRRVDLGIWVGINCRTRLVDHAPVATYECSLVSAITGFGSDGGLILTNVMFCVERPLRTCSGGEVESDKTVYEEILNRCSSAIARALSRNFPIKARVLRMRGNGWVEIDRGYGDGVRDDDRILILSQNDEGKETIQLACVYALSGYSLGRIYGKKRTCLLKGKLREELLRCPSGVVIVFGLRTLLQGNAKLFTVAEE